MRAAIAINNTIIDIFEAPDLATAEALYPDAEVVDADATGVDFGWVLNGDTWGPPAVPASVPAVLTHYQFIDLVQTAGDMSRETTAAAKRDPRLATFWDEFEIAISIERDLPITVQGLAALVETGYLTEAGREVIVEQWPMVG
ncbi:hypothetical protein WMC41_11870 [Shinella yambaruensis]|uniref:hypothetical protein n=1 Tax=Shinella yambaruensis TaxID=415996 RepID=UPI003D79EADE